jgi:hypothetical protein
MAAFALVIKPRSRCLIFKLTHYPNRALPVEYLEAVHG